MNGTNDTDHRLYRLSILILIENSGDPALIPTSPRRRLRCKHDTNTIPILCGIDSTTDTDRNWKPNANTDTNSPLRPHPAGHFKAMAAGCVGRPRFYFSLWVSSSGHAV